MQRLAVLVRSPGLHPIRLHGVLAPSARLPALVVPQEPERPAQAAAPAEGKATCALQRPARLSRAKPLKQVFEIVLEHCANCAGGLKIIAAILEQPLIEKTLTHLGLQARAPAARLSPWVAGASRLIVSINRHSGHPKPMSAGAGCVQASDSCESEPCCPGKPYGARYERATSRLRSNLRWLLSNPRTAQCVTCRGPWEEKLRSDFLSFYPSSP